MSVDVTTLGMAVDSSGVRRATDDLDKMTGAGERAAKSGDDVEKSFMGQMLTAQQLDRAIAKVVDTVFMLGREFVSLSFAVGKYQDLAEKAGTDNPAGIATLEIAAAVAGTSVESVTLALNRMTLQLAKGGNDSPAERALKSINLSVNEFRRLDPVEKYKALATALDGYADSEAKVRVIQAVTGRGGAEQLVMLKELASQTEDNALLTNEMIKRADDFSDAMARNTAKVKQFIAAVGAEGMLPVLDVVVKTFKDVAAEALGLDGKVTDLAKSAAVVRSWSESVALTLADVADTFNSTRKEALKLGAVWDWLWRPISDESTAAMKTQLNEIDASFKQSVRSRMEENLRWQSSVKETSPTGAGFRDPSAIKGTIDFKGGKDPKEKALREVQDAYEQVLATAQKRIAQETVEDELGRKLTAGEKLLADAYDELAKKHRALSEGESAALENLAAQADLAERNNRARKDEQKWMDESIRQSAQFLDGQEKKLAVAEALARSAEDELDQYGRTSEELQRLEIARLRDAAAQLRAKQMVEDFNPEAKLYNELLNQQADALDRAADARSRLNAVEERAKKDPKEGAKRGVEQYLKGIEDVGTETQRVVSASMQSLEDDMTRGLATGRADFKSTIDYMIQEALRLAVIRPILQSLFGGGGAGGGAGGLGGLLGGAGSLFGTLFGGGSSIGGIGFGTGAGFGNLDLGGFFAEGGRPPVGKDIVVGEKGPEVLRLDQPGTIIPNSKIGAGSPTVTYAPVIRIDSRTDQAQIAKIVNASLEENNRAFISQLKAAGVV